MFCDTPIEPTDGPPPEDMSVISKHEIIEVTHIASSTRGPVVRLETEMIGGEIQIT